MSVKKGVLTRLNNETLIAIVGPTAVGKTALSIKLALELGGEIVSGDSMQVYKRMNIGTAKASKEELAQAPHHLIDILEPTEPWTVSMFQERALHAISEIRGRGNVPILVGGTGLYVQAITHEFSFAEAKADEDYRKQMEHYLHEHGSLALHHQLDEVDPVAAHTIHPNNTRRVIRALEVIHTTGTLFSEQPNERAKPRFDTAMIGLTMERNQLYERINKRVDLMLNDGLLDEVTRLFNDGVEGQAIQGIGYKEIYAFLRGECSFDSAVDQLKQNSRRYAKRQLTWFRNRSEANWFDVGNNREDKIFQDVQSFLAGKRRFRNE